MARKSTTVKYSTKIRQYCRRFSKRLDVEGECLIGGYEVFAAYSETFNIGSLCYVCFAQFCF
jgi:hypothetical protein